MLAFETVTPAAQVAVSTATMKSWLRVDSSSEDTLIAAISEAAQGKVESYTGLRLITQTLRMWLDSWPYDRGAEPWWDGVRELPITALDCALKREIDLHLGPIQSVSSVKYYGTDNTEYTMSSSDYIVDSVSKPGRIVLGYGKTWPSAALRPAKAVAVQFVIGYGADSSYVPAGILKAIELIGCRMYENRGEGDCTGCEIPGLAKQMLDPYAIKRL